ncbi:agmatine deiminase family protein [Alloalcanivorax xenomutans]|uniref:agmatine deiminase family protein n=1 Tax=Alloalcanivorax xenomutans TaxID=1094342 RepID=UPI0003B90B1F|nr:agmatine deiminase [Alcanivorax sp. PN-3]
MRRLLPEWHPQWGVLLAWPDANTDWAGLLEEAEQSFTALIGAILGHENVLLLCRDTAVEARARECLGAVGANLARLRVVHADYDDTWARDFGPIAVADDDGLRLLDFRFNGWGGKFPAERDNALNRRLPWRVPVEGVGLVLEGGSIDTDGQGTLLTTRHCLGHPNRNPDLDDQALEAALREHLGVDRIWWLEHGHLEGDDTDAHVDTLARFVNPTTIAYVQCQDDGDSHYPALAAMERELQILAEQNGLTLAPLPMVSSQYNDDRERLPATYANFLITNQAILMPTYQCPTDEAALAALQQAAGSQPVIGIPCRALIEQGGSLHCVTMQLPEGVLED